MLSLLLFMATSVLWVTSYWFATAILWRGGFLDGSRTHLVAIAEANGKLIFQMKEGTTGFFGGPAPYSMRCEWQKDSPSAYAINPPPPPARSDLESRRWGAVGIEVINGAIFDSLLWHERITAIALPMPVVFVLSLLMPVIRNRSFRRKRRIASRRARGCCVFCGYDLRASAGRCPECGSVPEVTA